MMRRALALLAFAALLASGAALAHKPSDSYLTLAVDGETVTGQWDIALRDLDFALGLDGNQDGAITWGEVKAKHREIAAYALSRLTLGSADARCTPVLRGTEIWEPGRKTTSEAPTRRRLRARRDRGSRRSTCGRRR